MDSPGNYLSFGRASYLPAPGTPSVSSFNEKRKAGLLVSDEAIARHSMDIYFKYSLSVRARSESPCDVWGAFSGPRVAIFPQMDKGGDGEMEFGRIFAGSAISSSSSRGRELTCGSRSDGMGARGESTVARQEMTGFPVGRFPAMSNFVCATC